MKAVGQLTSGISHDFNNLLTVIGGNIELAALTEDPGERRALLNEAKAANERAAQLTSQLLAFSRKARLNRQEVDLATFVSTLRTTLKRMLPASLLVRSKIQTASKTLFCDPTLLESALLNLAVNARDATKGVGKLDISFANGAPENPGFCRITLTDNGPGIPAKFLEQVTEPFFTTKAVGQGSGLGLSMVKGFAEQSGGEMQVSSNDQGTTVTLLLPLTRPNTG
jgi:signal transduction histidine kinase